MKKLIALAAKLSFGQWAEVAAALAVVSAIGLIGVQTLQLKALRADLKLAQASAINPDTRKPWRVEALDAGRDLTTCRGNTTTLSDQLKAQNAALDRWKGEAGRQAAEAATARQAALLGRARAEREAGAILAAKPGADVCESADALILESLK